MKPLVLALVLALAASGCGKKKKNDPAPDPAPTAGSGSTTAGSSTVPAPPLGSAAAGSGSAEASGSAGDIAAELEKLELDYAEVDKQIEATITAVESAQNEADRSLANAKLDALMKAQKDLADRRIVLRAKQP